MLPTKENGGTYNEKLQKNDHGNVEESGRVKTAHDLLLHQSTFAPVIQSDFQGGGLNCQSSFFSNATIFSRTSQSDSSRADSIEINFLLNEVDLFARILTINEANCSSSVW